MAALGLGRGFPVGRPRVQPSRTQLIERLKGQGQSNREIARRVGVSEMAIRKSLRRMGWKEPNLQPFTTGTWLGTKKVLNIGAGFHYNAEGTYSRDQDYVVNAGTRTHDIKLFGADVFYDAPIDTTSNTALTLYGVYYNYDFGPNYVRNAGLINPGSGIAAGTTGPANLTGNALPLIGTGHSYYAQAGLLLPKNLLGPKARLQPYVAYLRNSWEGLHDTSGNRKEVNVYDAGLNLLLDGHNAKITLNYRARPDFSDQTFLPANNGAATVNSVQYRPEVTMQFQVYL